MGLHVVIVGGGIAGLSTAWYLQQEVAAKGLDITYTVLEEGSRWGGKILTEEVVWGENGRFTIEAGPDAILTQKPWALQLAKQIGLQDALLPTNQLPQQVFVWQKKRPIPMPDGLFLTVPTRLMPFARSPLISPSGKLRMGLDWVIPPRRDAADESLADFVRRRLGKEALDKIAEPMMAGIYNADAEQLSLLATFPRFRELEQKYGSLIRGMLAARRSRKAAGHGRSALTPFVSFTGGMRMLVERLVPMLDGECRLKTGVTAIQPLPDGRYCLMLNTGHALTADVVVLAVPAYVAARLIRPFASEAAHLLDAIRYVSTGTISLAYPIASIKRPLNGFGMVIPRSQNRPINAITCTYLKFNRRAPEGYALFRIFFGGSRHPEMIDLTDIELLTVVQQELALMLGITAEPVLHRIYRWRQGNPQYDVGHLARVDAIEAALPAGLYVTGSPYRGVGVPDCVRQGQETAVRLVQTATQSQLTPLKI
ncbi:MAG: protoporphyrinogen oxidase [Chloroflexi bacterium]|nr:MAG: protoporphyrinogen oxidase [Chloroflexota bacterium]